MGCRFAPEQVALQQQHLAAFKGGLQSSRLCNLNDTAVHGYRTHTLQ